MTHDISPGSQASPRSSNVDLTIAMSVTVRSAHHASWIADKRQGFWASLTKVQSSVVTLG